MNDKAKIINLNTLERGSDKKKSLQLNSGRQVLVHSNEKEELIEITEPEGEVIMKVRMTDDGPVVSVLGARLELKSTETIALEANKIKIQAKEEAVLESKGSLKVDATKKIGIHSDDDIKVVGNMIYLN